MTAEIAIMNKSAVALAADSAVTISHESGQKIYNTVNKLFALSRHCPVGIMIYGSAEIMGVPWETVIRVYQERFKKRKFDRLQDYGKHFFSFLDRKNTLFPQAQQDDYFCKTIVIYFNRIRILVDKSVEEETNNKGSINNKRVNEITQEIIGQSLEKWTGAKNLRHLPRKHKNSILKRHRTFINEAIKGVFQKLPLSALSKAKLTEIAALYFCKSRFPMGSSGIVIAGFGEKDSFPSVLSWDVESSVNNRLKYKPFKSQFLDFETTASVIPFAQEDVVFTFVEGTDPDYQRLLESSFSKILSFYPDQIVNALKLSNKKKVRKLAHALQKFGKSMELEFEAQLRSFRNDFHVKPLVEVVNVLPKDELAAMAESLVNLTCLKRKMSLGAETVGGPIDVAIISKGEGLVWIKRKHYFKSELNPQFFMRYNI